MGKYIDADRLKQAVEHELDMQDLYLPVHFFEVVDGMEAADVAEVVRCKDCKHSRSDEFEPLWCYLSETCDPVKADHFCGYGERKDG